MDYVEDFIRQLNAARQDAGLEPMTILGDGETEPIDLEELATKGAKKMDIKAEFYDQMNEILQNSANGVEILAELKGISDPTTESVVSRFTPDEFRYLQEAGVLYENQLLAAAKAGAYLSSCIMASAALETVLLMIAYTLKEELMTSKAFLTRKYQIGTPSIFNLSFSELISIALIDNWLSAAWVGEKWKNFVLRNKRTLEDLSEESLPDDAREALIRFLQQIRNRVHPSRFVRSKGKPHDKELSTACQIATSSYPELRDNLLIHLAKNAHKINFKL